MTYRKMHYDNTNYMLDRHGFKGAKTGTTDVAGPCLVAYYDHDGYKFIIVLLKAKSVAARWEEATHLVEWAKMKVIHYASLT